MQHACGSLQPLERLDCIRIRYVGSPSRIVAKAYIKCIGQGYSRSCTNQLCDYWLNYRAWISRDDRLAFTKRGESTMRLVIQAWDIDSYRLHGDQLICPCKLPFSQRKSIFSPIDFLSVSFGSWYTFRIGSPANRALPSSDSQFCPRNAIIYSTRGHRGPQKGARTWDRTHVRLIKF
jgi:hypothetical protein